MASIAFTDSLGAATLESTNPTFAKRFRNWVPDSVPVGPSVPTLATGEIHRLVYRTDHMASFEQPGLTPSQLGIAARLKIHLMNGGVCTITTTDSASRVYTARLAPGTVPVIAPDASGFLDREFVFSMVALNTATALTDVMRCTYSGPSS